MPNKVQLWLDGKGYYYLPHGSHFTVAEVGWSEDDFYYDCEVYKTVLCIPYIKVRSITSEESNTFFGQLINRSSLIIDFLEGEINQ